MSFMNPLGQQVSVVLKYLRKKRIEKEMSQYEMANRLCVSQNTYFKIEKGKTRLDMFRFFQICNILDLDEVDVMLEIKSIKLQ